LTANATKILIQGKREGRENTVGPGKLLCSLLDRKTQKEEEELNKPREKGEDWRYLEKSALGRESIWRIL